MTRIFKTCALLAALCLTAVTVSAQKPPTSKPKAATVLATGKPTVFKVTVTKVELYNGTSFVTIFTGSSQLDLVAAAAGAAFPGISSVSLPAGTYSQMRVTFLNNFTIKGSLASGGVTYYTTATTINSNAASMASVTATDLAEASIANPDWGALSDPVVNTNSIPSPVTITTGTAYAPTLKFDISTALVLNSQLGAFYFTLQQITISLV
jgi:hypothetical protein